MEWWERELASASKALCEAQSRAGELSTKYASAIKQRDAARKLADAFVVSFANDHDGVCEFVAATDIQAYRDSLCDPLDAAP